MYINLALTQVALSLTLILDLSDKLLIGLRVINRKRGMRDQSPRMGWRRPRAHSHTLTDRLLIVKFDNSDDNGQVMRLDKTGLCGEYTRLY